MDALIDANFDTLIGVDEIGEKIAISIQQFFLEEENRELVERLKQAGLRFEIEEAENSSDLLQAKTFVISGVFEKVSRKALKDLIELNGGKNTGSISKKTDYLVAGANMGPAKLEKANKLEVQIISEDQFLAMINYEIG